MRGLKFLEQVSLAGALVKAEGAKLIGRAVITPQYGDYPGGRAVITELGSDPNAPEIVFHVKHPTFGECGVFENEEVVLLP